MHVPNVEYLEGIKLYWGSKDSKKDDKVKKHQRMKQAIKRSKEPLDKGRYQMKDRYYDKIEKRVL